MEIETILLYKLTVYYFKKIPYTLDVLFNYVFIRNRFYSHNFKKEIYIIVVLYSLLYQLHQIGFKLKKKKNCSKYPNLNQIRFIFDLFLLRILSFNIFI